MIQIQSIGATKVHEIIAELSTAARNLLNHLVARCMLHAETSTRVTAESLKPLGLTRRQTSYALEVLKKRNLIEHRSERGRRGYEVKLNWGLLGLQVSRPQNQPQAQRQPRRQSPPTSPVRTPAPPQNVPQGASPSPRPPQAQPAPVQKVTSPSLPVRPSTSAPSVPKAAPTQPAASLPAPIAAPRYRAPLTPERRRELIANPPASFAALLDEVEPDWRIHTKPIHVTRVERINEEYRPAQFSPWALNHILRDETNRPASYIPSLFEWKGDEYYPGSLTLTNVEPDDSTGAKRAQRKYEEERRRREQEQKEERARTPEEIAAVDALFAEMQKTLGYSYTPKTAEVSR